MGVLGKVVDGILLLTFVSMSVVPACLDSQVLLPKALFPDVLGRVYTWYTTTYQDYLLLDEPHFFMALMKLELVLVLPLAILNTYGLLTSKPWFNTTCLIFGSALVTSTTAMVGDMLGSDKPSAGKLASMYSPFIGFGFLAILRGLLSESPNASKTIANGLTSALKKKA
ncbi:Transmembrane 97 [Gossypium arboreum]|uniref:Uncharacterized protein n=2 Tax=Gossypium arboreum TaxID=29729 RepID=A0ABR0MS24_GOSAR|nr:uncharacterized protein LOC108476951 [Gossypium arboreum]KAK5776788.1 hypothetical protein PVK06_044753 [Gossypium arboreum]KHG21200.1 Transmembrane 97 [Gossypium arboreum]